jgi:hypothetical protein
LLFREWSLLYFFMSLVLLPKGRNVMLKFWFLYVILKHRSLIQMLAEVDILVSR